MIIRIIQFFKQTEMFQSNKKTITTIILKAINEIIILGF